MVKGRNILDKNGQSGGEYVAEVNRSVHSIGQRNCGTFVTGNYNQINPPQILSLLFEIPGCLWAYLILGKELYQLTQKG